jgi:hypothetical protein
MAGIFQNVDQPRPSPPGECVPPAFGVGGGHTRWGERGVGGQYFRRRKTQLCTLHTQVLWARTGLARLHSLAQSISRNRFLGSLNVYKYGLWSVLSSHFILV